MMAVVDVTAMGVLISKVAGLFLVYREVELTVFITAGLVWKRRVSGVEGRWLESGCDGFDRPRIAVFKFTTNKPPCLFFRCLLSCETSLLPYVEDRYSYESHDGHWLVLNSCK